MRDIAIRPPCHHYELLADPPDWVAATTESFKLQLCPAAARLAAAVQAGALAFGQTLYFNSLHADIRNGLWTLLTGQQPPPKASNFNPLSPGGFDSPAAASLAVAVQAGAPAFGQTSFFNSLHADILNCLWTLLTE